MLRGLVCLSCAVSLFAAASYRATIEEWRANQERLLKSESGWLTVAGLFWLKEGENRFGSAEDNDIVLPAKSAPARAGVFEFHGGRTTLRPAAGNILVNGKPATAAELKPDSSGRPDVVSMGTLSMFVIKRGGRYGIRLRDTESRFRKNFTGRKWFPVKEEYRVLARFEAYNPPKQIAIPNVLGQKEEMPCPGRVVFTRSGREVSLEPVSDGGTLWFIFKDATSGKETYPAGRFLYTPAPAAGQVVLDFNRAENPPCAFTPYGTCPLPPRQNVLPVRIEAGELSYHAE